MGQWSQFYWYFLGENWKWQKSNSRWLLHTRESGKYEPLEIRVVCKRQWRPPRTRDRRRLVGFQAAGSPPGQCFLPPDRFACVALLSLFSWRRCGQWYSMIQSNLEIALRGALGVKFDVPYWLTHQCCCISEVLVVPGSFLAQICTLSCNSSFNIMWHNVTIVICKHSSDSFGSHDLGAASIPEKAGGGGRVEGEVGAAADKLSKNFHHQFHRLTVRLCRLSENISAKLTGTGGLISEGRGIRLTKPNLTVRRWHCLSKTPSLPVCGQPYPSSSPGTTPGRSGGRRGFAGQYSAPGWTLCPSGSTNCCEGLGQQVLYICFKIVQSVTIVTDCKSHSL